MSKYMCPHQNDDYFSMKDHSFVSQPECFIMHTAVHAISSSEISRNIKKYINLKYETVPKSLFLHPPHSL